MKSYTTALMVLLLVLISGCRGTEIPVSWECDSDMAPPEADILLEDIDDMTEYTGGMTINCGCFRGTVTDRIVVNDLVHESPSVLELYSAGYYRLEIYSKDKTKSPEVIRIVILDQERGQSEWGLPPWSPVGVTTGKIEDKVVKLIYPERVPEGFSLPVVVLVDGEITESLVNLNASSGSGAFLVKRGVGSTWLTPSSLPASMDVVVDQKNFKVETKLFDSPTITLSGEIQEDLNVPFESYVHVSADLFIPAGVSLTFNEGSFIAIDPAVNIYNEGAIYFKGSNNPVVVTCSNQNEFWGGFIGSGSGHSLDADFTIFSRSGYHKGGEYDWGHSHRQALFYCENGSITLDHCYMIDHIGQIFYPLSATVRLDRCLVQRAQTGGQVNQSQLAISHSIFTDFPDDSNKFRDLDNDGLYLHETDAIIDHTFFMYAKDDGLDTGQSAGGEINVSHSRFESNFHEGAALSSGWSVTKNHTFTHCIFTDCGQGLELGYSSPNHSVEVDSCKFNLNGIGIRYGDNYDYQHAGNISVSNSESLNNKVFDVWNMTREDWVADTSSMQFNNVWVTISNPMYPELETHE
jgi:hypothetical protein